MVERETELAYRLELYCCGDHVHVGMFDADGCCFGDAPLSPTQARAFAARIQAALYEMSALEDR